MIGRFALLLCSLSTAVVIVKIQKKGARQALAQKNYWGSVKVKGVNVYKAENVNAGVIASVNKTGLPVFIRECTKDWCLVQLLNAEVGYVKKSLIARRLTAVTNKSTTMTIDREGKKALAILYPNVIVKILKAYSKLCLVEKDGMQGYVPVSDLIGGV